MAKSDNQSNVPGMIPGKDWPGAFGIYKNSKAIVSYNLQAFLTLIICGYIADIAANYAGSALLEILLFIVFYLFILSSIVVLVAGARGQKLPISEALDRGTRLSIKVFGLYILMILAIAISFIALIVPGLIVLPRLMLAPYYLIDQDLGIIESLKTSWGKSEGHALKIWGVLGVQILFSIMAIIVVGIYFSIVYSASFIVIYGFVNSQPKIAKK